MLDILLASMDTKTKKKKLQEEHNLPITIKPEKEMNDMSNLGRALREESFREGYREGFQQSIRERNIEIINFLMSKHQFSFEESMEILDLDESKATEYLALMQTN